MTTQTAKVPANIAAGNALVLSQPCRCPGIYGPHAFKADGCNFGPGRFRFHAIYPR